MDELHWIRSTRCTNGGQCVEVAQLPDGGVLLRDSKNPTGPVLTFTPAEWDAFTAGAKDGEFDL
jgi:hypothetical protein